MKKCKKVSNLLIFLIIYPISLFSNLIKKEDINLLSFDEKKYFKQKCLMDNGYRNNAKCINYLGIKIFLNNYENNELNPDEVKNIEVKSISYLNYSAELGYKKAYLNLAWIYSNPKSSFFDLNKSSKYFDLAIINSEFEKKNTIQDIDLDPNNELLEINKDFKSAIISMSRLNLYFLGGIEGKFFYLTKREHERAKRFFNKIIVLNKIENSYLSYFSEQIKNEHYKELSLLTENLKRYQKEYRENALQEINNLISIYQKLN